MAPDTEQEMKDAAVVFAIIGAVMIFLLAARAYVLQEPSGNTNTEIETMEGK